MDIRAGDFKLLKYYENDLFKLAEDIGEKIDLSTGLPEKIAQLLR